MKAQAEAEARAAGKAVDYLTHEAPREFRYQLMYSLLRAAVSRRRQASG